MYWAWNYQCERWTTLPLLPCRYTFGERVNGTVKINATLEASGKGKPFLFYERTARLDQVQKLILNWHLYYRGTWILVLVTANISLSLPQNVSFRINTTSLHEAVRYRFDPFCVKSQVRITAEVEEAGRGTKQFDTISFRLVANPVRVRLADDNPQLFRAGLNYTLKVWIIGWAWTMQTSKLTSDSV